MTVIAHKFGGSSLADAECIATVADLLIQRQDEDQIAVVSAMAGVTNELIALTHGAARREPGWSERLDVLELKHLDTAAALTGSHPAGDAVAKSLRSRFGHLRQLLDSLGLMGSAPAEAVELISGLGEVFSAELLSARLAALDEPAVFIDARDILRVRPTALMVAINWNESEARLQAFRQANPSRRYVATGFICRREDGRISTLGRNGSDYSASIFGRLFEAAEIHIWTNVDGLLSADPGSVPEAFLLDRLSYREAFELAYFGARVIHPQALSPALEKDIPVFVRNTFNPACPGTRIDRDGQSEPPVKGLSGMADMALVTIEGAGMIGVPGTAERVFSALHAAEISVAMISQSSSEHSICLAVPGADAERATAELEDVFERELRHGQIQRVFVLPGIRLLAIVGDGMTGTPGVAARLFASLARAGVNVRAIAQGASERNISVAVDEVDAERALRAVHAGFYLSEQTVAIGLIGPGNVGRVLLEQLKEAAQRLHGEANLDLRLLGVAGSKRMQRFDERQALDTLTLPLDEQAEALDLDAFTDHIDNHHLPHSILIDCTASDAIAERYAGWLARGIHVITPNKHAGSGPIERYRAIRRASQGGSARWRYDATVGAGLPVIQTLRDLIDTGDRIRRIDGIFSGTLAYLFNRYSAGMSFAELVGEAREAGYTEPDPRDDLSGMDVARKLVILAREMGLELGLDQVRIESLAPAELDGCSIDEFLAGLADHDEVMARRLAEAESRGEVLRFVAGLSADGQAEVALKSLPGDHPFASLALTDNVVAFTTDRYCDNPLIVQGPGAGPAVTAAGVFADLLRVASHLGARL
ncbi:bifunctional aspartate kinase/homoserine dehydrogenase I [Wenzhouxiangella marina]|uniref:Bifunctional aspartokinase/homoserine dehydrogenase n=1 Tax=Wenzhouxiangella marina TaxID=1579979 RepID=A0A0K0XXQ1_9GAMM|nr:bifunctional aspartate kinase/homoserine dehydrogenase I [Wenzhouxiangella marina]AKS42455.1 Aspartate kinase [Wenzhouxiangella marina]MBB6085770.1 aspartokinase/homoserine dehydrogenase 1 [Wenzhouxiangella marina]